jgi:hypothetical protein
MTRIAYNSVCCNISQRLTAALQALIVGPFPFLVNYSSQLPPMQAPAGSERHLLLTRSFCAAVLGVSATYWLRFRLKELVCEAADSGAADSGGGKLELLYFTVAYFSRTYTAIKLVGWCAAKIRRPLSNVLSNTPQPLPARHLELLCCRSRASPRN